MRSLAGDTLSASCCHSEADCLHRAILREHPGRVETDSLRFAWRTSTDAATTDIPDTRRGGVLLRKVAFHKEMPTLEHIGKARGFAYAR